MLGGNAAENSDAAVTLADRLKGFGNAVWANIKNEKFLWRTGVATASSFAIASYSFR